MKHNIRWAFFAACGATAVSLSPALSQSDPANVTAKATIADMQAIGTASSFYPQVYVTGPIGGGVYTWVTGTCTPDNFLYFQATGVSTSVGCWKFSTPSWAFGGTTYTGGGVFSGSLGQSSLNGIPISRQDAQIMATNAGKNVHGFITIDNSYVPESDTPICSGTGNITGTTLTFSACALNPEDVVTGSGIPYRTIVRSGSSPTYIVNNTISTATITITIYPPPQESALGHTALTSTGVSEEIVSFNAGWTNADNANTSGINYGAICPLRQNNDGSQSEPCPIIVEGNGSVLLGANTSGGNYATMPAGQVEVFNNLGGTSTLKVNRINTSVASALEFSTGPDLTSTSYDWGIGTNIGTVGASDFSIYNYSLGSNVLRVDVATNDVTLSSNLTVAGIPNGSGGTIVCAESDGHLFKATTSITGVTCN